METIATIVSEKDIAKAPMKQRVLILAGVLGPIIYILNVMLGGIITPNYSHIENAVSELTQRGVAWGWTNRRDRGVASNYTRSSPSF